MDAHPNTPIRLAHFSDVHLTAPRLGWRARDLVSKRLSGWVNFRVLGRRHKFGQADQVIAALMSELREDSPDRVVFSGDVTALGFEAEFARAAEMLGLTTDPLAGIAVPGNHDHYVRRVVASRAFERHFGAWLVGERVDAETYPFAQRVGPAWLVAVNTSEPTRLPWDARGRAGQGQLSRLRTLLAGLDPGPRLLVTHYPVCRSSGEREKKSHALRDLNRLVEAAAEGGVCLWLHGHRHNPYHHAVTDHAPFPVVCAGSTTQSGFWSYKRYTLVGRRLHATRRTFDPSMNAFRDAATWEIELTP